MRILILATLVVVAGCFNPHYDEGAFACGTSGTAAKPSLCPSGLSCFGGRCYSHDPGDAGTGADRDGPKDVGPEAPMDVPQASWPLGHTCTVTNANQSNRTDNCQPGLVCAAADGTAGGGYCFRTCSVMGSTDGCDGTKCEIRRLDVGSDAGVTVCGWAATVCDPTVAVNSGCPDSRLCYLQDGITICESQSAMGRRGEPCDYSRDCLPNAKLACVGTRCLPVCSATVPCASGIDCVFAPGATYGSCPN